MSKRTSKSSVGKSSKASKKSKMEYFHQQMLVIGASDEKTADKSFITYCKENTLKPTDDKCLQAMSETAELG